MPQPYWTNRAARPDETAAILRLVRTVHGDEYPELNEQYWQWRYLNDLGFHADILMADHDGQPIGIRPVAIFDYQWGQERLRGAMHTGTLTHPDHRRRGVFSSLIKSSNEHMTRSGTHFCISMPNNQSLPGLLKSGDWVFPGLIPLWMKVIDGAALLAPRLGRPLARLLGWLPALARRRRRASSELSPIECEPSASLPPEFDDVFDAFARDCGSLMIRRTAAYWNWRYGARPHAAYRTFMARQNGSLVGAVVTSKGRRAGMDVGMILDVVARGGIPVLRQLIHHAEADLRSRGLGLATCQATGATLQQALREEGYLCPNPSWLPKRFNFVFRTTGLPGMPRSPSNLSDWHLTFGDSDNT